MLTATSHRDLAAHLSLIAPSALVLWDLNGVILTYDTPFLRPANAEQLRPWFRELMQQWGKERFYEVYHRYQLQQGIKLIDPAMPGLIIQLSSRGVQQGILSAVTGEQIRELRCKVLESAGLHFDPMLFARPHGKNDTLRAYLAGREKLPTTIILIDDLSSNIIHVADEVEALGIPFIGIEYRDEKLWGEEPMRAEDLEREKRYFESLFPEEVRF